MNKCAKEVMLNFTDIIVAYGESDEYSFVFRRKAKVFNRRKDKILSCTLSLFTSSYVFYWNKYITDTALKSIPTFDGRIVLYPNIEDIKNYLSWRQVDCHINNQYNTVFWCLVNKAGMSKQDA
jgi:tRNA(His) guanylyltransferase